MITIDGVVLNLDEALVQKYMKLTGDTAELFAEVVKIMVKGETGMEIKDAALQYSTKELSKKIEERLKTELRGFWEV